MIREDVIVISCFSWGCTGTRQAVFSFLGCQSAWVLRNDFNRSREEMREFPGYIYGGPIFINFHSHTDISPGHGIRVSILSF